MKYIYVYKKYIYVYKKYISAHTKYKVGKGTYADGANKARLRTAWSHGTTFLPFILV